MPHQPNTPSPVDPTDPIADMPSHEVLQRLALQMRSPDFGVGGGRMPGLPEQEDLRNVTGNELVRAAFHFGKNVRGVLQAH